MIYDWEKEARECIAAAQEVMPGNLRIVGLAVENTETGEGALVQQRSGVDHLDVTDADVFQDIMNDAGRQYIEVYEAVFGPKGRVQ